MCGIVGYTGKNRNALTVALEGLEALEYRGYDSAGIAAFDGTGIHLRKTVGRVKNLADEVSRHNFFSSCAIAFISASSSLSINPLLSPMFFSRMR